MRLVTFSNGFQNRVGVITDSAIFDLELACEEVFGRGVAPIFSDMRSFLSSGDLGLKLAKDLLQNVKLSNDAGKEVRPRSILSSLGDGIHLRAPIPRLFQSMQCPEVALKRKGSCRGRRWEPLCQSSLLESY